MIPEPIQVWMFGSLNIWLRVEWYHFHLIEAFLLILVWTLEKSDTKNCLNIFNVTSVKTRTASNSNLVGNHRHNWNQRWFSFSYLDQKWEYKPFCNAIHKLRVGSAFKALSSLVPSLACSFSLLVVLVTYLKVNINIIKTSIAGVILDF